MFIIQILGFVPGEDSQLTSYGCILNAKLQNWEDAKNYCLDNGGKMLTVNPDEGLEPLMRDLFTAAGKYDTNRNPISL